MSKLVHILESSQQRASWREHFDGLAGQSVPTLPLMKVMGERLLERLDGLKFSPKRILDVGCGSGDHALELRRRFPDAQVIAMDWSTAIAKKAAKNRSWWRPQYEVVVGDATHPPIQPQSVDLVFANFLMAYAEDVNELLIGLRGALKPGGLLLISGLGPDTLVRERQILGVDPTRWLDVQRLGGVLTRAGFNEPVLDTDWMSLDYRESRVLDADLSHLGVWLEPEATSHRQALMDAVNQSFSAGTQQVWSTTWECLYGSAFAPDEGQTIKSDEGTLASIPIDQIGIRRR